MRFLRILLISVLAIMSSVFYSQTAQKVRRFTMHKAGDCHTRWSPDGARISYTVEETGNRDIWVIDIPAKVARPGGEE